MARAPVPPTRLQALRELERHPALAELIPALPVPVLGRLYQSVGLNDAGPLMAVTPPAALARALEDAVWATRQGASRFDADVFVDWLEVWLNEGEDFAGPSLAALDEDLLARCFSELVRVDDALALGFAQASWSSGGGNLLKLDRFLVAPCRDDDWDPVRDALVALWEHDSDRLMALLERLTLDHGRPAGAARDHLHRDAAAAREAGRERAGFVPPEAARAFLALATALSAPELTSMDRYDAESARHLRPRPEPEAAPDTGPGPESADPEETPAATTTAPRLWTLLHAAGITDTPSPAGLLTGPSASRALPLEDELARLAGTAPEAFHQAARELAYLANVAMAAVTHRDQSLDEQAARDFAFATCNLGGELLAAARSPVHPGREPGLVKAFLSGYAVLVALPRQVVRQAQAAFASPAVRQRLERRPSLADQLEECLDDLARAVSRRRFADAREAITLLSLVLDIRASRAAAWLLDALPAFPALLEEARVQEHRWIASRDDLAAIAGALATLSQVE